MTPQHNLAGMVPPWYRPRLTARSIIDAATDISGYTRAEITGPLRRVSLCRVRWAVMLRLRDGGRSYPQIGRMIGGRDHRTIMHGVARAGALVTSDAEFAGLVRRLATLADWRAA